MKKTSKKLISFLLCVLLLAGTVAVGFNAFAEDEELECTHANITEDMWTLTQTGHKATCPDCKEVIEDAHDYDTETSTCKICGYTCDCANGNHDYGSNEFNYKENDYDNHYVKCNACGEEIPFTHVWEIGYETDGYYHWIKCRDCDIQKDKEAHTDELKNYVPDEGGNATTDGKCDVCGCELSHRYKKMSHVDATCTTEGYDHYECLNGCGSSYDDKKDYPALGHCWTKDTDSAYVQFTYDETNYTYCTVTFTCKNGCGNALTYTVYNTGKNTNGEFKYIPADYTYTSEDYDGEDVKFPRSSAPTCTEYGTNVYVASFDIQDIGFEGWYGINKDDPEYKSFTFDYVIEIPVAPLGHTFGDYESDNNATCQKDGTKTRYCTVDGCDGSETITDEGSQLEHSWSEYTYNDDAGCGVDGTMTRYCQNEGCDAEETIADPDHPGTEHEADTELDVVVDPTCTDDGEITHTCKNCHNTYTEVVPATGHSWSEYESNNDATCEKDGTKTRYCTVEGCGAEETITDENSITEHEYKIKNSTPATCTSKSSTTYRCVGCGDEYTEYGDKELGHNWNVDASHVTFTWDEENYEQCEVTIRCMRPGCSSTQTYAVHTDGAEGNKVTKGDYVDPTCEEDGYTPYTAEFDPQVVIDDYTGDPVTYEDTAKDYDEGTALGHDYTVFVKSVPHTCTEDGYDVYQCSRCDATENRENGDEAAHDWSDWVSNNDAGCHVDGTVTRTCQVEGCGETETKVDEGSALEHDNTNVTERVEPTCETDGYEKGYCTNCEAEYETVLPALGHEWGEWVNNNDATCLKNATRTHTCTREGCNVTETEEIPNTATGKHAYSKTGTVKATCEGEGTETYMCKLCGDTYTITTSTALGHKWTTDTSYITYEWDTEDYEFCTLTMSCARKCGNTVSYTVYKDETTQYGTITHESVEADCLNAKGTKYTATFNVIVTGDENQTTTELTTSTVVPDAGEEPLGHDWSTFVYNNDASCTTAGTKTHVCMRDGCNAEETVADEEHPALGHDYTVFVETVSHTYTKDDGLTDGYDVYQCSRCEAKENKPRNEEHEFGEIDYTVEGCKEVTCTTDGIGYHECTVCGYGEIITVPATGHTVVSTGKYKKPTCTTAGYKIGVCETCGEEINETLPALGTAHDWGEWTNDNNATCTKNGTQTRVCQRCSEKESQEIANSAKGHTLGEVVELVEPTCTKSGYKTCKCTDCQTNVKEILPALGHDWSEYSYSEDSPCVKVRCCQRDGCDAEQEITTHKFTTDSGLPCYAADDSGHWVVCDICGQEQDYDRSNGEKWYKQPHVDSNNDYICDYCGYEGAHDTILHYFFASPINFFTHFALILKKLGL